MASTYVVHLLWFDEIKNIQANEDPLDTYMHKIL